MTKREVILDSGAFSAWSRGESLDIDTYIAFILANADLIDYYVALDVIPGSFGVVPSAAQVEESARASWENLLYMESHGLKPMPVFHMGESFKWLHKMLDHGCTYVGISPANDRATGQKRLWLDRVFTEIGDSEGRPRVWTHGLGVTSVPLLTRYPWYSCDSSSWIMQGGLGAVMVPRFVEGLGLDYNSSPLSVYMSGVKTSSGAEDRDYRTLAANVRKHVDSYIEAAGTSIELCKVKCEERSRVCAYYFKQFERHGKKVDRFIPHRQSFFGST